MAVGFGKWVVGKALKEGPKVIKSIKPLAKMAGAKLKEGPKFTKDQLRHMKKSDKRIKKMKKEGYEGPKYDFSGKKTKSKA